MDTAGAVMGGGVGFVTAEFGGPGKVVKGAPYTATATTQSTQTLSDGNRIVQNSTANLARDTQGRTRREETLKNVGPWATTGEAPTLVFINDPVAQANYVLNSSEKTAQKMARPSAWFTSETGASGTVVATVGAGMVPGMVSKQAVRAMAPIESSEAQKESLGSQTMQGVTAEGTRTTRTIPAGQIGNDKPITIVNEVWYSQDLQAVVMSKHSDPRMGETVYTLTNIQRGEPDASLFAVPSDYTVQEGPPRPSKLSVHVPQ
jgi:hypothetical protein